MLRVEKHIKTDKVYYIIYKRNRAILFKGIYTWSCLNGYYVYDII